MQIEGTVAIVTGADRGISSPSSKRCSTAERPPSTPARVTPPVQLDVTDPARVAALGRELVDVRLVVNHAGIGGPSAR